MGLRANLRSHFTFRTLASPADNVILSNNSNNNKIYVYVLITIWCRGGNIVFHHTRHFACIMNVLT